MNDLVSVIIPAYNAEQYIAATIQSVLNQTHQNIEIIVVNDGSTDQTLKMIDDISSDKVKVLSKKNGGASAAKQTGLEAARGNYIQYLDADDLLSEDKIASQIQLLQHRPNAISLCATVHFFDQTDPKSYPVVDEWYAHENNSPVDFLKKIYGGNLIGATYGGMIQPNAFLTPINVIKRAMPWNTSISPCPDEDGEYFCRAILAASEVIYAKNGINYYRKFKQQNSLSAVRNYIACKNMLESTLLKTKHLLLATNKPEAKLAMGNQLWNDAFSLYPRYKQLSAIAEKKAEELYPRLKINPFKNSFKMFLSQILGWKFVLKIDYYRFKLLKPKSARS
jgi:glycosyltransferase involved in cell wall biosynthesis